MQIYLGEVWHFKCMETMEKRFQESQRVALMGIAGNAALAVIKMSAGILYRSQALMADGANSIGDIINSAITFVGNKVASRPKDNDHQYGHGKAEAIATQTIGIILSFIALKIFTNALSIFSNPSEGMGFNWIMIAVPLTVIITKIFMYIYARNIGRKYSNPLVLANAADHAADIFVTSGTILGIVFTHMGLWWMDPVVGMIISFWILVQAFGISRSAIKILMDSSIDSRMLDNLRNSIALVEGVAEVQKLTTHTMGIGYSVEVRIGVNSSLTVEEGHKIASRVKARLLEVAEVGDVIVHINPVPGRLAPSYQPDGHGDEQVDG
jgi:cation diffusion facilitator family transporter